MHEALKTLHVLAVIFLGGTILLDAVAGILMPRLRSVGELRGITQMSKVNQFLGLAAAALVPIFGYAAAAEDDLDLGITWLLLSQILFWAALVVAIGVLMRGAFALAARAQELPDGPIPDDVSVELKDPLFPILGTVLTAAYIFIVYLMVVQPGW